MGKLVDVLAWFGDRRKPIQLACYGYVMFAGTALVILGLLAHDWLSASVGVILAGLGAGNLRGVIRS